MIRKLLSAHKEHPLDAIQLINWFWKRIPKRSMEQFSDRDWEVCQCGTEKLIASCRGYANRMRTFLLISVFIDQIIYTHYRPVYPRFRDRFMFPKLVSHGGYGMVSSSWLVYPKHGYDKLMDWDAARPIAKALFAGCLNFLQNELGAEYAMSGFIKLAAKEIRDEFEERSGQFLREVISEAAEEINRPTPVDPNNDGEQLPLNF